MLDKGRGRERWEERARPIIETLNTDADNSTPVRRAATDNPGLAAASAADRQREVKE